MNISWSGEDHSLVLVLVLEKHHLVPRSPTQGLRALFQRTLGVAPYAFYNLKYSPRDKVIAPATLTGLLPHGRIQFCRMVTYDHVLRM